MHRFDEKTQELSDAIAAYATERLALDPVPLDRMATPEELQELVGQTITPQGLGRDAFEVFTEKLAVNCLSVDHPRYLSFIPCAPTREAAMFDLVVGASSIYSGSWMEGSGAVYAENQALRWIADLVGLPETAGGSFVQGGTVGNLSALVAARADARRRSGKRPYRVAATAGSHSSIASAAEVMDAEFVPVEPNERLQLDGEHLRRTLEAHGADTFFAVVVTVGTTNLGIIDDVSSVAEVCREYGLWLHVDGAYGGAGLAAPSIRDLYAGVEHCDSFIVDPHKWLFSPFDCCALIYRDPVLGRAAHTQHASYLDVLNDGTDWNPSDFSVGLTRRSRGLPFWFSLAVNGTDAYTEAVERTLEVARFARAEIDRRDHVESVYDGDLTVIVFRRKGWEPQDYQAWSDDQLAREESFVVPTSHDGETLARFAIVNPMTSEDDITAILDSMR